MRVNSITLVGRAAGDPEVRYFESGALRTTFTLLVSRRSAGDAPDAFPVEIWGKPAQAAADTVRKDCLVGVIGSLKRNEQMEPYVHVDRLELLGPARQPSEPASF